MTEYHHVVANPVGILTRQAGVFVRKAQKYSSTITIEKENHKVDAKKIYNILCLRIKNADTIVIKADGEDEETAIDALSYLAQTYF